MKHYELKELDFSAYEITNLEVIGGSRPRLTLLRKKTNQKHFLKTYSHNSRELFAELLASKLGVLANLNIQQAWIKTLPLGVETFFKTNYPSLVTNGWVPIGALVRNIFPKDYSIRYGSQIVGSPDSNLKLSEIETALREKYYAPEDLLQNLADMIVFDAWIGNMDRHHENWGVMEHRTISAGQRVIVASVLADKRHFTSLFDHGSSLLFELQEENVLRFLNDHSLFLDSYILGAGYTFLLNESSESQNPFDLIRSYAGDAQWKRRFDKAIKPLLSLHELDIAKIVLQMPSHKLIDFSDERRKLLFLSLRMRLEELGKLI